MKKRISEMSDSEKVIAILEACGWDCNPELIRGKGIVTRPDGQYIFHTDVPDCVNDLNAMHEVEKTLNEYKKHKYTILIKGDCASVDAMQVLAFATATQRADAFLLTIGHEH